MRLGELKRRMLLPQREYIINQRATIRGIDVQVQSFTIDTDSNRLWLMYRSNSVDGPTALERREFCTRREELLHSIADNKRQMHLHITAMEIGGQLVTFGSSSSHALFGANMEAFMHLQHFAGLGLLPERWDDAFAEQIAIAQYEQTQGEPVPCLQQGGELPLVLQLERSFREVLIEQPFEVQFGQQAAGTKVTYFDPLLGRDTCFYIDEVYSYDPYRELFKDSVGIDKAALKHLLRAMEGLCPQGNHLAVIRYEAPDDLQLNFFTQDYLDAAPVHSNRGGTIGFLARSTEIGPNGYRQRECVLQPVARDFCGRMKLELFSRVEQLPEERVTCSLN